MKELLFVAFVIMVFGGLVWVVVVDNRNNKRVWAEAEAKRAAWLAEQETADKYRVVVTTKNNINKFHTTPFEAKAEIFQWMDHPKIYKQTSFEEAKKFIHLSIESDHFQQDNVYIPMCEIVSMEIQKV
jgi:hypothetical protein